MKVVESFLTRNPCYKTNRKIAVQGIALYTVGCPQPSAKVFVHNWNTEKYSRACVHAFIDANDGLVYQTLPWNHRGWHGDADGNNTRIGVMLCEPHQIKYRNANTFDVLDDANNAAVAADRVYQSAVELCGQLCVKYDLNPITDIWAPENGNSNPEHVWSGLGMDHTMAGFRSDVVEEMKRIFSDSEEAKETVEANLPEEVRAAVEAKSIPVMRVRVVYDNLRIRSGPGTNCTTTGTYTGQGDFEIIEVQNGNGSKTGWGRLADGRGWISLDFAERI